MTIIEQANARTFPEFNLKRLIQTVFLPDQKEQICFLIDLEEPKEVVGFQFLTDPKCSIQKYAHDVFYQGFKRGELEGLDIEGGEIFAYRVTGGSNLDMPDEAFTPDGMQVSLERDVYRKYSLVLCMSTYSATAPLTAHAKKFGFRGATLHGLNEVILRSGLAVDYNEVSREAEKMRSSMTRADAVEIDFAVSGRKATLRLELGGQEAQKSHGLCHGREPDVANLPAGEVYFVPVGADGEFPMKYEDGTLGMMHVQGGKIRKVEFLSGNAATTTEHQKKIESDPVTGEIGELGFGTQILPVSGRDIQDEKVLGTLHVATGRSDHLGGHLTPDLFAEASHATHDDILFAPHKTPEINVPQARLYRDGETHVLIENFQPCEFIKKALAV